MAATSSWSRWRRRQIEVRFVGACDGCPASALTFHAGVKKAVEDACPEITDVLQVKGTGAAAETCVNFVSPFALHADRQLARRRHLVGHPAKAACGRMTLGGEKVVLSRQGAIVTCFQNACAHLGFAAHMTARSRTASSPARITASATISRAANA